MARAEMPVGKLIYVEIYLIRIGVFSVDRFCHLNCNTLDQHPLLIFRGKPTIFQQCLSHKLGLLSL